MSTHFWAGMYGILSLISLLHHVDFKICLHKMKKICQNSPPPITFTQWTGGIHVWLKLFQFGTPEFKHILKLLQGCISRKLNARNMPIFTIYFRDYLNTCNVGDFQRGVQEVHSRVTEVDNPCCFSDS